MIRHFAHCTHFPHSTTTMSDPPFHNLLLNPDPTIVDYRMLHDYIGKRKEHIKDVRRDVWSGVYPSERSLAQCMEESGCLDKTRVLPFVDACASQCNSVGSRALAIEMLTRSVEADDYERPDEDDPERPSKADPGRLDLFLQAGGLLILKQWMSDASDFLVYDPDDGDVSPGTQAAAKSHSFLLLPLLKVLKELPVQLNQVKDSKINRPVRDMSKVVDHLVQDVEELPKSRRVLQLKGLQMAEDEIKGLQTALNELKSAWSRPSSTVETMDPFAKVVAAIKGRLQEHRAFQSGDLEKPAWLVKAEEQSQPKKSGAKRPRESTEELAKRERQRECDQLIRDDLKKWQEERRKLREKLRDLKNKQTQSQEVQVAKSSGKRVKWKDGLSTKLANKGLLETVFMVPARDAEGDSIFDAEED